MSPHPMPKLSLSQDAVLSRLTRLARSRRTPGAKLRADGPSRHATWKYAAVGIAHANREGEVFDANAAFISMLGRSRSEVVGRRFSEFAGPDDHEPERAAVAGLLLHGDTATFEKRYVRADGATIWADVTLTLVEKPASFVVTVARDITARKANESSLRVTDERSRLFASATKDAMFDWSVGDSSMSINEAFTAAYGAVPATADPAIWWLARVADDDRSRMSERWSGYSASPAVSVTSDEYRVMRADGALVPVMDRRLYIRDASGALERLVAVVTDLTSIRATESALHRSEARFRKIFETDTVGISFWCWDGRVLDANDAYLRMTGYDRDDLAAQRVNWRAMSATASDADAASRTAEEVMTRGQSGPSPRQYRRKDGSVAHVLITAATLEGDAVDGVSVAVDIGELHVANEVIRENEERFRLLVENSHDMTAVVNAEGTFTYQSPSVIRMLGFTPEELVGTSAFALVHPDDLSRVAEYFHSSVQVGQETGHLEYRSRTKDGSWRWLDTVGRNLIDDPRIRGVVLNTRDITVKRQWQKELEREQRTASLGRLAATMAHEFNNVLMSIQPFAEMVTRRAEHADLKSAAGHIRSAVKRGTRVTSEILRFTQMAAPRLDPVNLADWLEHARAELQGMMPPAVSLRINVLERPLCARVDHAQLTQALTNLVLNARDSMPGGGTIEVSLSCEVVERPSHTQRTVVLTVKDDGHGISPEVQQKMFDPLFTTKRNGTGLGLPLTAQIVAQHGGGLTVESESGTGTTFRIQLPAIAASDGEFAFPYPVPEAFSITSLRVLLVEDEPSVAEGVAALLEMEGCVTHIVHLGAHAEGAVRSFSPDIVLLDIGLPDVSGFTLYEQLRAVHNDLPIVIASGHVLSPGETPLPDALFVQKPYDLTELLAVFTRCLASAAPR